MTLNILTAVDYEVKFDRDTRDYAVTVDQQFIGCTSTYLEGEALAREYIYDLMEQGKISDDPRELCSDADFEVPNYKLSPAQRAWLARQLGVVVLPSVEVVTAALEALANESTRSAEQRAYRKAATFVAGGVYPTRDGDGWQVVGSTGNVYHVANGRCDCTAGTNSRECWHESLVYGLNVAMNGGGR